MDTEYEKEGEVMAAQLLCPKSSCLFTLPVLLQTRVSDHVTEFVADVGYGVNHKKCVIIFGHSQMPSLLLFFEVTVSNFT